MTYAVNQHACQQYILCLNSLFSQAEGFVNIPVSTAVFIL
jgi:hypothetical protein